MTNAVLKFPVTDARQMSGTVVEVQADTLRVRTSTGEHLARRAFSCVVEPAEGDYVLCAVVESGESFVLSILERTTTTATRVNVHGSASVELGEQSVKLSAQSVELQGTESVSVRTQALRVSASTGNVFVKALEVLGDTASVEWSTLKTVARHCDGMFERLSQHARRVYRMVEEFEHVRAERLDYAASKMVTVHAKNTVLTADELVKLDAGQIHLG